MIDAQQITEQLGLILTRHPDVPGVSLAISDPHSPEIISIASGYARNATREVMSTSHILECASLSKTVASAFAIQLFEDRGISLSTSVNQVLSAVGSPFRLRSAGGFPASWADEVTLKQLMNHTSLPMPYVYGIPLSDRQPSVLELMQGLLCAWLFVRLMYCV